MRDSPVILAVTSLKRHPSIPDVPTLAEVRPGRDWSLTNVVGVLHPPARQAVLDRLNTEIARILKSPEATRTFITTRGNDAVDDTSPGYYADRIKRDRRVQPDRPGDWLPETVRINELSARGLAFRMGGSNGEDGKKSRWCSGFLGLMLCASEAAFARAKLIPTNRSA